MTDKARQNEHTSRELLNQPATRRKIMSGSLTAGFGLIGGAMMGNGILAAPGTPAKALSIAAQETAATPAEFQILMLGDNTSVVKVLDFWVKVYERASGSAGDTFSEPLVRVNRDFDLLPASAESWEPQEDGLTWLFKIRDGLTWSDGNPVTANDWVATFRHAATPENAWDFTWFFQGILKNWSEAVNGELPPEEIGIRVGENDLELIMETTSPAPYLPSMLVYSYPLSAAGLAEHGMLYNTNPETAISAGPYILSEWIPDQQITLVRNEKYTGTLPGLVDEIRIRLTTPDNFFTMYQANEIDTMGGPAPAALTIMMNDEETAKEVYSSIDDFPTYYVFFDVDREPWNDIRVRQAWSHAIDRDLLKSQILGPNGLPAYSFLAPGFPANNTEGLKDIQAFDPEKAKALLAEAGYPDGKDFPKQQLMLRSPAPIEKTAAEAIASMIKANLNIELETVEQDQQSFMAALTAKPTQMSLGFVRYGMDYLDPFSMLNVWVSGGRHSWANPEFDEAVQTAAEFLGDPAERMEMFKTAERILVEEVPAVFVYHGTGVQFIKPWVTGDFIAPDKTGNTSMHWPSFSTGSEVPAELFVADFGPKR